MDNELHALDPHNQLLLHFRQAMRYGSAMMIRGGPAMEIKGTVTGRIIYQDQETDLECGTRLHSLLEESLPTQKELRQLSTMLGHHEDVRFIRGCRDFQLEPFYRPNRGRRGQKRKDWEKR